MVQQLNTACLVIDITFEVVGSIFCLGRLWSRLVSMRGSWRGLMMWSDICMFAAWLFTVGETIGIIFVTVLAHYGYHNNDLYGMKTDPVALAKWSLVSGLCYNPILGFVKASMILLYLRLGGTKKGVQMACYGLLTLTLSLTLALDLADAFECSPVSYVWNSRAMDVAAQKAQNATEEVFIPGFGMIPGFKNGKYVAGGKCFDRALFIMVAAGLAILTDLMILCIPVYMVYDLKLSPRKKLVVLLILCMGICITAVSITRLIFAYQLVYPKSEDGNFNVHSTISQIESGLALVTGNIPDLFPMIRRWYPNFLRSESPDVLVPNPYPYRKSGTGSANSAYTSRLQKILNAPMGTSRIMNKEEGEEAFGMQTYGWRGDIVSKGDVQVKGGAARSLTESEEAIIDEELGKAGGIVKTTQFVVQEDTGSRPSREDQRWSSL